MTGLTERQKEIMIEKFVDFMEDNDIIPDDIKGVYDDRNT